MGRLVWFRPLLFGMLLLLHPVSVYAVPDPIPVPTSTPSSVPDPFFLDGIGSDGETSVNPIGNIWGGECGATNILAENPNNWQDGYTPSAGEQVTYNDICSVNSTWNYIIGGLLTDFIIESTYTGVVTVQHGFSVLNDIVVSGGKLIIASGTVVIGDNDENLDFRVLMAGAGILAALLFWVAIISNF